MTGSSRGIGADIAVELARKAFSVVVHGRDEEAAQVTADRIDAAGGEAKVVIGDLTVPADCDRVADEALAAFGGIDILVNNAGVSPPSNWDETRPELWLSTFETNVMPAVRLSMKFAQLMKAAGWGRLIHIGSSAGAMGLPRAPEYSASKAAFANMSSSLAKHFGQFGITSNVLGVGTIDNLGLRLKLAGQSDAADPFYEMLIKAETGHYNMNPVGRTGRPRGSRLCRDDAGEPALVLRQRRADPGRWRQGAQRWPVTADYGRERRIAMASMSAEAQVPEHIPPALAYDFYLFGDAKLKADPYARVQEVLREAPPVFWSTRGNCWMITRYDALIEAFKDTETFSNVLFPQTPADYVYSPYPLQTDPPRHKKYSDPLKAVFSARRVADMEATMRELAVELIDAVAAKGHCDFIPAIAEPYPILIFLGILGVEKGTVRRVPAGCGRVSQRTRPRGPLRQDAAGR